MHASYCRLDFGTFMVESVLYPSGMLQPNLIVHLKDGATVDTEGGEVEAIDRVAGRSIIDTDEVRDGELIQRKTVQGQNGGFTVDASDVESITRL
jgi:hypothetical protein